MKKESGISFGIGIFAGLVVYLSFTAGLFRGLENFFEDLLFSSRPISGQIVIADIDSDSISKIGQWPWPRKVFADAISTLSETSSRPLALGVDVVFSEPSRIGASDDDALSRALGKASYPIVLAAEAEPLVIDGGKARGKLTNPLREFTNHEKISSGHVNLVVDADGIARSFPLFVDDLAATGIRLYALSYQTLAGAGLVTLDPTPFTQISAITRIAYAAKSGAIRHIPFYRIADGSASTMLKDKIVLIGATASDLHDATPTPLSRGTPMPGVEIQANIANMLLMGYELAPIPGWLMTFLIFLSALLPVAFFSFSDGTVKPVFASIIFGVVATVSVVLLFERGFVVNLLHVNFAWILSTGSLFSYRYMKTERDRRHLKNLFGKYVSKDVLEEILRNPERVELGGAEKEVTVFFSDIRSFTTLSEGLAPGKLVTLLNRYFTLMTDEILKHGGVIDKYIGDAIMAFWGAPIENADQADRALKASLAMIEALNKFNVGQRAANEPEINIGIGLYTGPAIVGNVGSEARVDYTVMGDTVNVASRLEGLNKEYKTNIIIGETTKNKLKGKYDVKPLGTVSVKGRKEPLTVYSVNVEHFNDDSGQIGKSGL